MNLEHLFKCIGQTSNDENLVRELLVAGVDLSEGLDLPEGEYRTYVERPENGFSLVFTDEAMFLGKASQAVGLGELFMSGVFLYAEGKDGYSQYKGSLPLNLSFDVTSEILSKNFGDSSWNRTRPDGSIAADRWDNVADYRIHITYSKSSKKAMIISLNQADHK